MNLHPRLDVLGQPYLSLRQVSDRLRKVSTAGDLVRPLATDSTETDADLVRAHEADRLHSHVIDRRRETISLLSTSYGTASPRPIKADSWPESARQRAAFLFTPIIVAIGAPFGGVAFAACEPPASTASRPRRHHPIRHHPSHQHKYGLNRSVDAYTDRATPTAADMRSPSRPTRTTPFTQPIRLQTSDAPVT